MPILSVKKTRECPDREEMVEIPNEVFTMILFMLDGSSLHTARQVCKEWNWVIETQVLGTARGRREMERTLQFQWREKAPTRSELTIDADGSVLTVTDELAAICYGPHAGVRLINIRDGAEVFRVSRRRLGDGIIPAALLSKDVLLVVKKFGGELKVLAWNLQTKAEIFRKKLPAGQVVLDRHNQQVMVGRDQGPGWKSPGTPSLRPTRLLFPGYWRSLTPTISLGLVAWLLCGGWTGLNSPKLEVLTFWPILCSVPPETSLFPVVASSTTRSG